MDQSRNDETSEKATGEKADQLKHLRELVVGPTANSIEELRDEIRNRSVSAEEVGDVLAEAIQKGSKKKISRALGPTLSDAFQDSVKRQPQALVDAISPIMGPAIRRAISQQIQAMVQSLNTALDHSLSPRGIRWRLEAYRTGKPFAEVVLLHTLVYRIEQLLLIDPETGLLMQGVSGGNPDDDADLVSALLTAIQDFTRDSFEHRSDDEKGSNLRSMKTNELNVWIEHGPSAILAAAVRGEPPIKLRQRMQEVLERLHIEHAPLLSNFQGDTDPLEVVRPDLEDLLESEYVNQKSDSEQEAASDKTSPAWMKHLGWAIPACLLLALLVWGFSSRRAKYHRHLADVLDVPPSVQLQVSENVLKLSGSARHAWIVAAQNRMERLPEFEQLDVSMLTVSDEAIVNFFEAVRREPGITIHNAVRNGDRYVISGWQDPLARDPSEIMMAHGVDPQQFTQSWEPYHSVDPQLALRRLKKHIDFPATITSIQVNKESGKLLLKGTATLGWLQKLQYTMDVLETGEMIDISEVTIADSSS